MSPVIELKDRRRDMSFSHAYKNRFPTQTNKQTSLLGHSHGQDLIVRKQGCLSDNREMLQ
jgi:hypothetical protein